LGSILNFIEFFTISVEKCPYAARNFGCMFLTIFSL